MEHWKKQDCLEDEERKEDAREGGRIWSSSFTLIWTRRAVGSSAQPSWCHTNDGPLLPLGHKVKSPNPLHFIIPKQNPAALTVLTMGFKNYFIALATVQFAFLSFLSAMRKCSKIPSAQMGNVGCICMFLSSKTSVSHPHCSIFSKKSGYSSFVLL